MHPAQLLQAGATNGQGLLFNTTSGEWEASDVGLTINAANNYLPKRQSATAFINSLLYDNGASIGLNTVSPNATFHIYQNTTNTKGLMIDNEGTGDATISLRLTGVEEWLAGIDNSTTNNDFVIANSGLLGSADRLIIDGLNGNIGIGASPTSEKLYVGGGIGLSGLLTLGTGMDANSQNVTNLLGETYGAGWNNDYSAAAKHDIYTKIETISTGGDNLGNHTATSNLSMGVYNVDFTDPQNTNSSISLSVNDAAYPNTGLSIRALTNPADTEPIFRVMSSGGSERLRVEHNGVVSTTNPISVGSTGQSSFSGEITMNSKKIVSLGTPTASTDAATKAYVDAHTDADASTTNEIQTLSISGSDLSLSNGGGTVTLPSGGSVSGMGYLDEFYKQKFTSVSTDIAAENYGVGFGENFRPRMYEYKGKYHRLYFIYEALTPNRTCKIAWYDLENNVFSDTAYQIGTPAPNTDTHNGYAIIIDDYGYIIIISSIDDGQIRVFRSNYAELDNAGSVDVTTTLVTGTGLSTYSNYGTSAYMSDGRLVTCFRGDPFGSATQEDRTFAHSSDDGKTWTQVHAMDVTAEHWLYGEIVPDSWGGGVFYTIRVLSTLTGSNYPAIGVLWSKDMVNFGNLEYYATGGEGGWSKDVVTNGAITHSEMLTNLMVYSGIGTDKQFGRVRLNQLPNGSIVINALERNGAAPWDFVTSFNYNAQTLTLDTLKQDFSTLPGTPDIKWMSWSPYDLENNRFWATLADSSMVTYVTTDGGASWQSEQTVVSDGTVTVADGNFLHLGKHKHMIVRDRSDITMIREGESNMYQSFSNFAIKKVIVIDAEHDIKIIAGSGTPVGNVKAGVGSTFHRTDGGAGTAFYVKESGGVGTSGWVGK